MGKGGGVYELKNKEERDEEKEREVKEVKEVKEEREERKKNGGRGRLDVFQHARKWNEINWLLSNKSNQEI